MVFDGVGAGDGSVAAGWVFWKAGRTTLVARFGLRRSTGAAAVGAAIGGTDAAFGAGGGVGAENTGAGAGVTVTGAGFGATNVPPCASLKIATASTSDCACTFRLSAAAADSSTSAAFCCVA